MSRKRKVTRGNPAKAAAVKSPGSGSGWVPSVSLGRAVPSSSSARPMKSSPAVKSVKSSGSSVKSSRNRVKARKERLTKAFVVGMVVVLSAILAGSILVTTPTVQAPGQPYEVPAVESEY